MLLGPVSYLLLGKMADGDRSPLTLVDAALPVYAEVLSRLAEDGAVCVQLDEPALITDLPVARPKSIAGPMTCSMR